MGNKTEPSNHRLRNRLIKHCWLKAGRKGAGVIGQKVKQNEEDGDHKAPAHQNGNCLIKCSESFQVVKVVALGSLVWWLEILHIAEGWNWMIIVVLFNPRQSMILILWFYDSAACRAQSMVIPTDWEIRGPSTTQDLIFSLITKWRAWRRAEGLGNKWAGAMLVCRTVVSGGFPLLEEQGEDGRENWEWAGAGCASPDGCWPGWVGCWSSSLGPPLVEGLLKRLPYFSAVMFWALLFCKHQAHLHCRFTLSSLWFPYLNFLGEIHFIIVTCFRVLTHV